MFTLGHFSDPHLSPLMRPRLLELAGKRLIGHMNWRLRRRLEHQAHVLDAVVEDLAAVSPDHIAVTGDLVNTSAAGEFAPARTFLERLGPPDAVTLVPGNHDAYVPAALAKAARYWGAFMTGDEASTTASGGQGALAETTFPFVRRRGPVALVGLLSAIPTGPFMAWGRLGQAQIDAAGPILSRLGGEGRFRVVLLHHPPVASEADRFKRLLDRDAFRAMLRRHGAELVLHGHNHVGSLNWVDGPETKIPVVGVPSASALGNHDDPAGYHLYAIAPSVSGWRCEMLVRRWQETGDRLVDHEEQVLHPVPA